MNIKYLLIAILGFIVFTSSITYIENTQQEVVNIELTSCVDGESNLIMLEGLQCEKEIYKYDNLNWFGIKGLMLILTLLGIISFCISMLLWALKVN